MMNDEDDFLIEVVAPDSFWMAAIQEDCCSGVPVKKR